MPIAYVSIGSNIRPRKNVVQALRMISERCMVNGISTVFRTSPELNKKQRDYYNAVVSINTELPPEELKREVLREIENSLGRKKKKDPYASRTIDLDLLSYGNLKGRFGSLTLPDPEIEQREYVARGLEELDPSFKFLRMSKEREASSVRIQVLSGYSAFLRKVVKNMNKPMALSQAKIFLKRIPPWKLNVDGNMISLVYRMKNFAAAIDLINRIAVIAEKLDHHPGIHLTNYRNLRVTLKTDAIGGLSNKDFEEAAAISKLRADLKT